MLSYIKKKQERFWAMNKTTFIIFGATGDLATKRLIPALYEIIDHHTIDQCLIIGVALEQVNAQHILQKARKNIELIHEKAWNILADNFYYYPMDITQAQAYQELLDFVRSKEREYGFPANRLLYLAIPPQFFAAVTQRAAAVGLITKHGATQESWSRVVYEKPFGGDKDSAHALNQAIAHYLEEEQIFRIDHYLAKDIVGNIALLRFTNRVFEPLWNKDNIAWVQIDLKEDQGLDGRGSYYDKSGAICDVLQNHMLQILALIAMEAPVYLSGEYIRDAKAQILKSIVPIDGLLAQYEEYHQEAGVAEASSTETFAMVQLRVNNERWQGVPFFLKTGKALDKKETVIRIRFKDVPCLMTENCQNYPNSLIIRVAPLPGFSLILNVKKPGMQAEVTPVAMNFCYDCKFGPGSENSYQVLLQELFKGEPSVSVRFDEIEYAWDIVDALKKLDLPLYVYKKGSGGPEELAVFERTHGISWDHYKEEHK